jgi:hypothetical protein
MCQDMSILIKKVSNLGKISPKYAFIAPIHLLSLFTGASLSKQFNYENQNAVYALSMYGHVYQSRPNARFAQQKSVSRLAKKYSK